MSKPPSQPAFVFFGTPRTAHDTLLTLLAAGYRPAVVVTSPDAPRGRGLVLTPCETKVLAEAEGIPVLSPTALDDAFLEQVRGYNCAYAIVVAYGKLLPQRFLDAFPAGVINVHYSLLPKYRGAAPVEAALREGEEQTGVTVQRMALKLDAGGILAQEAVPISPDDTVATLRPKLIEAGAKLLIKSLPDYLEGKLSPTPQDELQATFATKISKEKGLISLKADPFVNWSIYRAYRDSPGTFFYAHKADKRIRVKILDASFRKGEFVIKGIIPESRSEQDFALLASTGWEVE